MNRRHFFKNTLAAGLGWAAAPLSFGSVIPTSVSNPFTLNYAPHFGMFEHHAGSGLTGQLQYIADQGFRALEDNNMKQRPVAEQRTIAREMRRLNLQMGVFVGHTIGWQKPNLTTDDPDLHRHFIGEIRESIAVARRLNARWITVVPGRKDPRLKPEYQTANVIEALKRASALLEPEELTIVIEPLNPLRDHPGMFLTEIAQAYQICKAVDSPSCKILFDVYHQQITEGNLIPNIDYAWDQIAYFQVGDHPGRNEPLTGEINYPYVFDHLHRKGYDGIIGMEHGLSMKGMKGEEAVIDAYRKCDPES